MITHDDLTSKNLVKNGFVTISSKETRRSVSLTEKLLFLRLTKLKKETCLVSRTLKKEWKSSGFLAGFINLNLKHLVVLIYQSSCLTMRI